MYNSKKNYWLDSSKNVLWLTKSWWMSHLVCRSPNGSHHTKIFFLLKATRKKSLLLHTPHAKKKEYDAFLHVWDVSLHSSCCTRPPPPILPRNCTPGLAIYSGCTCLLTYLTIELRAENYYDDDFLDVSFHKRNDDEKRTREIIAVLFLP